MEEKEKRLPIESQADIPPDSWDSAPLTEYGCGKGENPLFSIVEGKGMEQDVSVRNDLSLLSAEESLSQKILPHVRSLVKAKKSGDKKAMKHHERAINKLAGKKVIPRSFTEKEMESPEKLAKVISCISQVKEKGDGVNPFAVCRDQIMGAPEDREKVSPIEIKPHTKTRGWDPFPYDPELSGKPKETQGYIVKWPVGFLGIGLTTILGAYSLQSAIKQDVRGALVSGGLAILAGTITRCNTNFIEEPTKQ